MSIARIIYFPLILTVVCCLHSAFGFNYQNSRWRLTDLPVQCYLNIHTLPDALSVKDVDKAVNHSLDAWNEAAGLQIFQYAGRVNREDAFADDGYNTISFVSTDWVGTTAAASAQASIVGTTCLWRLDDPIGRLPRHAFRRGGFLRAFDIALNAEQYRWAADAAPGRMDVQSVVTHELGHTLWLGHTDDANPQARNFPTMGAGVLSNDTKLRTLEPDDIAGVQFIYRKASGILAQDAHWQNTVLVEGDLIVPRGVRLQVSPSSPQTVIHLTPGSKLIVEGGLTVDDSNNTPVLFTGFNGATWGGIEIRQNDLVCDIANYTFEGTPTPLMMNQALDVSIKDCEFRRLPAGIQVLDGKRSSITNCIFDHSPLVLTSTADSLIQNCEFHDDAGLEIQSSRDVKIIESTFTQNDVGIRLIDTEAEIRSAQITENAIGVEVASALPIRLRENDILHNEVGVQIVRGTADLGQAPDDLGHNNLLDNTVWNLALTVPSSTSVFAAGNHWGELTSAEIDRTIRDDDEVPNLPAVQFEPLLSQISHAGVKVEIIDLALGASDTVNEGLMDGWGRSETVRRENIDGRFVLTQSLKLESRTVTLMSSQAYSWDASGCLMANSAFRLRAVNEGTRIAKPFRVVLYISPDDEPDTETDVWPRQHGFFELSEPTLRYVNVSPTLIKEADF